MVGSRRRYLLILKMISTPDPAYKEAPLRLTVEPQYVESPSESGMLRSSGLIGYSTPAKKNEIFNSYVQGNTQYPGVENPEAYSAPGNLP